jgi:hypothetical protein
MATLNVFNITHNQDKVLPLKLRFMGTLDPVPLDTVSEIVVKFIKADGTFLLKKLSLSEVQIDPASPKLGRILVPLTAADSVLLKEGLGQDIEIDLTQPAGNTPVRFSKVLNVYKQLDEA